jgi:hypothetical protein
MTMWEAAALAAEVRGFLARGRVARLDLRHVRMCSNAQTRVSNCCMLGASDRGSTPLVGGREMNAHLNGEITMLYTIAVILVIAWLLGIVGTYTIGAFVHVLLVVAIVLFVVGLLSGRSLA